MAGFAGVGAESSSYMYYINNRQQQLNLNLNLNLEPKEGAGQLLCGGLSAVIAFMSLRLFTCRL